ncbi:olfactory receptor, family 52, subfamily D, member 1 [Oryctolagus cuniculus]|uniref:Olfactory receptor n=1 Tax=Oryctolagus cuniculus TaxID=9986 RepID=B8K196_RABIT|nr:olfactory receptor, family 52, subfamily D, member 1 [Oryctolagus cuniculus]ACK77565.1 olfactory receptor, family 52, subfamily D, member 1 (predicted) [Oryctolagus cuniculus]
MSVSNISDNSLPATLFLTGFPGLEPFHIWIAIPFCAMYLTALAGNAALILVIVTDRALHAPMYLFLCILSLTDLALSSTTVPKMLAILWMHAGKISFSGCLAQMFCVHSIYALESSVLLAMAFDRYVAICNPLRYTAILNHTVIGRIGFVGIFRSVAIVSPFIFLLRRLPYCRHRVMAHTYCEHMGIARLACANITVNIVYGLTVALLAMGLDSILIAVSYGFILRAVFRLPSRDAQNKALSTCGSHLGVILVFYIPAFFSFLTHRFGHNRVPKHVHIFLANLYVLVPPVLNPIIYGARTKEIQRRLLKLFHMGKISI